MPQRYVRYVRHRWYVANGRLDKHIATAHSLGLKKIGQTVEKADNEATRGMVKAVTNYVVCEEA